MLAGRKLLLADDSITIQKVVDLTFADEGVSVLCVNNGRDAIEQLEEFAPDVVLADVFMPQMNGYEVCEYIKQNQKLKHIPVMLLVGSFEPFDEAEARRVGADDTLTKPFESIRRLIDKVGLLVSGRREGEEAPTAELPKPEPPEPEKLSEQEIEITTADTLPLPAELRHVVDEAAARAKTEGMKLPTDEKVDEQKMESKAETRNEVSETYQSSGDALLDLGEFQSGSAYSAEEFVLDIDLDVVPEDSPVEASFSTPALARQDVGKSLAGDWQAPSEGFGQQEADVSGDWSQARVAPEAPAPTADQLVKSQEFPRHLGESEDSAAEKTSVENLVQGVQTQASGTVAGDVDQVSAAHLSPEVIDAIARRAVEHLSEKVVQEIAWEVVPQLAELLIKRQLEEKNS